jgi:hypothetical protein
MNLKPAIIAIAALVSLLSYCTNYYPEDETDGQV